MQRLITAGKMATMLAILLVFVGHTLLAGFDLFPYQQVLASDSAIPDEILYPRFFRESDKISLQNIANEIRARLDFFKGLRPEPSYFNCYKMQRRIEKSLERMLAAEKHLPFNFIDDRLIYDPLSPLFEHLRPMPLKSTDFCSFKSYGSLAGSGTVYCVYHGSDIRGDFFQRHQREANDIRPLMTAFDVVELLIFLPALLLIPVIWLILKKSLEKKQPSDHVSQG
jgi:hypothetical protein